jgi:hypothetical protein
VTANETGVERFPAASLAWHVTDDVPAVKVLPLALLHDVVI